jgi:hypothetical protein
MGLMFFGGLMNLYWIAGLALFVLCERTIPAVHWRACATGAALLLWGAAPCWCSRFETDILPAFPAAAISRGEADRDIPAAIMPKSGGWAAGG